jgi:uncharacterized membrane protein YhfC
MQVFLLSLNFLIMIFLPVLLGWYVSRQRRISWRFFGIGAASFILAQVLHIPFNHVVETKLPGNFELNSQTLALILRASFLGLSAGLFEEGARYIAYKFWAKDARTYGTGIMMGAGHGGAESILLGVLGALNVVILLGYRSGYFQGLVPAEQAPLVIETTNSMLAMPWFEALFGAMERAFALCIQVSLSLLVLQVFLSGRLRWLLIAIIWHSLIDAAVVIAVNTSGTYAAEALTGISALMSLLIILGLRKPEPKLLMQTQASELSPLQFTSAQVTKEKLEDSRFV